MDLLDKDKNKADLVIFSHTSKDFLDCSASHHTSKNHPEPMVEDEDDEVVVDPPLPLPQQQWT